MKKVIGWGLIISPFAVLFARDVAEHGFLRAAAVLGTSVLIVCVIGVGGYLASNN